MADNQEIDDDKSSSIKNNYKDKSDENKAGLGGKLKMVEDEDQIEAEFPELDGQKDFSAPVDLTELLKKWPVKRSRWVEVEPATSTSEDHQIRDSCDPVALAREYLKKYGLKHTENVDKSEPAKSISEAKTLDTNPSYKSGHRKTDGFSVESRSNGVVPGASKLASESDSNSNFDEEIIKKKNKMDSIKPCESEFLQNGCPVTPKHPEPVPNSGTKPQPKEFRCSKFGTKPQPEGYRCSICGRSFPTYQAMGGHKGRHQSIKPCESEVLQNGSPVTPKHPEPVPNSGTKPQPKEFRCSKFGTKPQPEGYQCSICGRSFPTFQAMGGHKGHHRQIP